MSGRSRSERSGRLLSVSKQTGVLECRKIIRIYKVKNLHFIVEIIILLVYYVLMYD